MSNFNFKELARYLKHIQIPSFKGPTIQHIVEIRKKNKKIVFLILLLSIHGTRSYMINILATRLFYVHQACTMYARHVRCTSGMYNIRKPCTSLLCQVHTTCTMYARHVQYTASASLSIHVKSQVKKICLALLFPV